MTLQLQWLIAASLIVAGTFESNAEVLAHWRFEELLTLDRSRSPAVVGESPSGRSGTGAPASTSLKGMPGGDCRRSVCLEYLFFNPDGTIRPIVQTLEGVSGRVQRTETK